MTRAATDCEAMLAAVADSPEDWPLYGVAADCLEEAGDSLSAECLRWAARARKRARRLGRRPGSNDLRSCWYNVLAVDRAIDPASDLPKALYQHLRDADAGGTYYDTYYDTAREALAALLAAWALARKAGWSPEEGEK